MWGGWWKKTNAESLRCGVSGPVSPSSQQGVWPFSQNLHAFFSANHQKGGSRFCQLDRLVKWNNFDVRDSSRGDRRRYFWLMDLLLWLALPLSVNWNCYVTKVATHIKLPLSRSVLPESRPFEVTTLWRGKGVGEERVRGVRSLWGKRGNQRVILWGFDTGEWLTTGSYTCGPHTCWGVHHYKYMINER